MAQPLVQPKEHFPLKSRKRTNNSFARRSAQSQADSAAALAARLQLQEEKRELTCNYIYLFVKTGLLVIALASSVKLGLASHQRISRNNEIASVLKIESQKLKRLNLRFDSLFSIGGKQRLLEEQDQLIAPRSRRIIWR